MEALEEERDFLRKTVNQLYGQGCQTLSLGPSPASSVATPTKQGKHVRCFPQRGSGSQHCGDECPSGRDNACGAGVPSFTGSV